MNKISSIILLASTLCFGSISANDHMEARALVKSGTILPLEDIINQARIDFPGRILDVSLEHEKEGYVYELELVDEEGHVWELEYDATTGKLLEKEKDGE